MNSPTDDYMTNYYHRVTALVINMDGIIKYRHFWIYAVILFIGLVLVIIFLMHRRQWTNFAQAHKWWSRVVLFPLMIVLLFSAAGTKAWVMSQVKGTFSLGESVAAMAMTIKIGMYGVDLGQQIFYQLPAEQKNIVSCVGAVSAYVAYGACPDSSAACIENLPKLSREDIVAKIKDIQSGKIPSDDQTKQTCLKVDPKSL